MPSLADFAIRLAGGLAGLLLLTSWRQVPPRFFRTHCQVILGLFALAALDLAREERGTISLLAPALGGAVLGYLGAVAWGLGLPRLGVPITALIALVAAGLLVGPALGIGSPGGVDLGALGIVDGLGRLASAFLMGATLSAMLLGHHYLTAPAMAIDPLRRYVVCMAVALGARAGLAALGWGLWTASAASDAGAIDPLFLAVRWGMGVGGPALATFLTWRTVLIRSTQSATGILYIAMILVLFGELTGLMLGGDRSGVF